MGRAIQLKTALGTEKERKIKRSLTVEAGARERTSRTHKKKIYQKAAEQRDKEELREVGDELKMSA